MARGCALTSSNLDEGLRPTLSVAAVARRLGVAPATLRTWDRRYGLGPSERIEGRHRRYSATDVARLEAVRRLLLDGVPVSEAVRVVGVGSSVEVADGTSTGAPATGMPGRPVGTFDAMVRRLREALFRLDEERLEVLLGEAVLSVGVLTAWDAVLRPLLRDVGARWEDDAFYIAAEHLLSECTSRVLHRVTPQASDAVARPVLLCATPGEAHVLPLHALAAALHQHGVRTRLVGASTPSAAIAAALARTDAAALVVWSQFPDTADAGVFTGLPRARGGRLLAAAGPGWGHATLPGPVVRLDDLAQAVSALAPG